jgi:hypothetical protein
MALFFSVVAIVFSAYTVIEIKAFQRSTHKVEFMPIPEPELSTSKKREFMEGFMPNEEDQFII